MSSLADFKGEVREHGLEFHGRYYGLYPAFVADIDDPEQCGRVKLKIPDIYGDEEYDYWSWSFGMFSGQNIGFFAVPSVGDMVWVSFEKGDPAYPLWTYGHYGKGDLMEKAKADYTKRAVIQTQSGNKITSDDTLKAVQIEQANGTAIEVRKDLVNLGSLEKAAQPVVRGDDTVSELEAFAQMMIDLCTANEKETHQTPAGMSAIPTNIADFTAVKTKLIAWKAGITKIKSKIVRTD